MNSEYETNQIYFGESEKNFIEVEKFGMGQEEKRRQNIPWKGDTRNKYREVNKHGGVLVIVSTVLTGTYVCE